MGKFGIRQGCLLNLLLFAIMFNDFEEAIEGRLSVGGVSVNVVMYTDI